MQTRTTALPPDQVARRWCDLADRRRSYFIQLHESGRWKLYYSEADFLLRLREVFLAAEKWEKLASARLPKPTN